jgi:hypothetical protein
MICDGGRYSHHRRPFALTAGFERAVASRTCVKFASMLPYRERLIHVRWSGEACLIPLGDLDLGLGCENATSYPAPGQLLLHPDATEGLCFRRLRHC